MKNRSNKFAAPLLEILEPRVFLSATPAEIAEALDLPAGVTVTYTGSQQAVQDRELHTTEGLLGFPSPTGDMDNYDFLMLSTGNASWIDTRDRIEAGTGTDLGLVGPGLLQFDNSTITFTLDVPVSARTQKLKLDFMFFTQEVDEWRASAFQDQLLITVNGDTLVDLDITEENTDLDEDNMWIVSDGSLPMTGTFFDSLPGMTGRTEKYTATYVIAPGTPTLDVVIDLSDYGDALYDSAVFLDNFRIENSEYVYLNFDGMDVGDHFGWGSQTTLPTFQTLDIRSYDLRANVIDAVLQDVQDKYYAYDIEFGITPPADGEYTTCVIGGSGGTSTTIVPILQALKDLPASTTLNDFLDGEGLLGLADQIDIGNIDKDSLCVVLAQEFNFYGPTATHDLAMVIAHEVGHTLGLRHVTDSSDIMATPYEGDDGFEGEDTFTYTITDEDAKTSTATVTVTVGNYPQVLDDEASMAMNGPTTAIDVLANDTLPALTVITGITQGSNGAVHITGGGTGVTYLPNAGYHGIDTFTYTVTDGLGHTETGTVSVIVGDVVSPEEDYYEIPIGAGAIAMDVLANDIAPGGTLIGSTSAPANGTVLIVGGGTSVTYQPNGGWSGRETFTYTVTDVYGADHTGTVTVDTGHVADPSTANDDIAAVDQYSPPVQIDVLANDTEYPDWTDLAPTLLVERYITEVTQGSHGAVEIVTDINGNGIAVTYKPDSASFVDAESTLLETWSDGLTVMNTHQYLLDVLGANGGESIVTSSYTADYGSIYQSFTMDYFWANLGYSLYNVVVGNVEGAYYEINAVTTGQHVTLPFYDASEDQAIFIYGSTTATGARNIASGLVTETVETGEFEANIGTLGYYDTFIPLYNVGAMTETIPLARYYKQYDIWQELARSNWKGTKLVTPITISPSKYFADSGIDWLVTQRGRYNDADGDVYSVSLRGNGQVGVVLNDPDGDGNGSISQILVEDSDDRSNLCVYVSRAVGGDGLVDIGQINAPTLNYIYAPASDLTKKGVEVEGFLRNFYMRDIGDGAQVQAGGSIGQYSTFRAHQVNDNSKVNFGSELNTLYAAQVGDALIAAPAVKTLYVYGDAALGLAADFSGQMTLGADAGVEYTLIRGVILGNVTNSRWHIASGKVYSVTVYNDVTNFQFHAYENVGKLIFGTLTDSEIYVGVRDGFTAMAGSSTVDYEGLPDQAGDIGAATLNTLYVYQAGGMAGSNISAGIIGKVWLTDVTTVNGGRVFGVSSDSIYTYYVASTGYYRRYMFTPEIVADNDNRIVIV